MKSLYPIFPLILFCIFTGCSRSSKQPGNKPDHIVIVIEENHGLDQIVDNPDATYINALIHQGLLFTDSHGVTHPSQPNYIALFSGDTQGVTDDRCLEKDTPYTTPNLGHELLDKGYTFAGYSETMPENGFTGCGAGKSVYNGSSLYARKHNPWVDWQGNSPTGLPANTNLTFKNFPTDFSKLPTVVFVVPNQDNEMHNGPDSLSIKRGDDWLRDHMDAYIQWAKTHNSLFIVTYDEDNFTKDNRIPTIFVGAMVKPGNRYDATINHYNVLRTIEELYGLDNAGPANEKPIEEIWNWGQQGNNTEKSNTTSSLKLNQIQVVGTHNSYKVAIDTALMDIIREKSPESARSLSYAHLPISDQLDKGARNLEYDVYYDPEGGRFVHPYGLELLKKRGLPYKPFDPSNKLEEPGLKVFHVVGLDFRSHHLLFRDALTELKTWSEQHPDHVPIFVTMNTKDGAVEMKEITKPLPFTETALDSIDMELAKYLGKDQLITPDMVRQKDKTLKESVTEIGWPLLDSLRGRFLFILDQSGEKMELYIKHHPSLKGRMMFVNAPESYPEAATMIINNPITDQEKIQNMVRQGFIVRTRADADTEEARKNDYSRWEAAKKSGAQIITTDYIVPSQTFSSSYQVKFADIYRLNPVVK